MLFNLFFIFFDCIFSIVWDNQRLHLEKKLPPNENPKGAMAYSKFIALMFGTQQIGDYLYGRKSRDGDFDEDRIPPGHGTVPKTGQFPCASSSRPPSDLREIKPVAGSTNSRRSKRPPFEVRKLQNQIHRIEMSRRAHQLPLFGSDLVRFGDLERLQPVGPSHPEGAAARLAFVAHMRTPGSGGRAPASKRAVP